MIGLGAEGSTKQILSGPWTVQTPDMRGNCDTSVGDEQGIIGTATKEHLPAWGALCRGQNQWPKQSYDR